MGLWRRKRTSAARAAFTDLKALAKIVITNAKEEYFRSVFSKSRSYRDTWSELRRLDLLRKRSSAGPLAVSVDLLNDHFADVCTSNRPCDPLSLGTAQFREDNLYFQPPTTSDLERALSTSTSKSRGVDGIGIDFIKMGLPVIAEVILHILSYSILYEVYPTKWKHALIRPIAKTKNPSCPSDYRPISLLCVLSKILERIISNQIIGFLEAKNLLDPYQSAYRKGHNTQTALLRVLDEAKKAADERKVTIMVFFDFSKAFDRVSHHKLILTLRDLGFSNSTLNWVFAYLNGRRQAVLGYDGNISPWASIDTGVPQGSVLGPLLFSLFISGFSKVLTNCSYNIYADDIQISLCHDPNDLGRGINLVNEDIVHITRWVDELGLLLNATKTKAIIVGTSRHINNLQWDEVPKIRVSNKEIEFSEHVEYLGRTISSTLSWKAEASRISRKVYGSLHQLKFAAHLFSRDMRKTLITTLILPILDYCSVVMTGISKESELLLQRSMNSCVRFIFRSRRDEHITPYFKKLSWLKLHERRKYFMCCLLFSVIHTGRPCYLSDKISFHGATSIRSTHTD